MTSSIATALDPVALLGSLLHVPSPTGDVECAAGHLVAAAAEAGFDSHRDAAGNALMRWGDHAAGPGIMLLGHLDTVPGDIAVRVESGRLHGRGAVDAKGPLAAALSAVSRLPRSGTRAVTVVAVCDEEGDSLGARHLLSGASPSHLVVLEPSGSNAVTTGYRGCVRATIAIEQRSGHHAIPQSSAADRLVRVLHDLRRDAGGDEITGRAVDRTQVRINALTTSDDAFAERAAACLEVRLPQGVSVNGVVRAMRAAAVGSDLVIDSACEPVSVARTNPVARALARAIASTGARPRYTTKTGTSDLNVVLPVWRCPAAVYGPGDSSLDHTPDESIELDELRRGTDILEIALRSLS